MGSRKLGSLLVAIATVLGVAAVSSDASASTKFSCTVSTVNFMD
jgi:hypothetical protein